MRKVFFIMLYAIIWNISFSQTSTAVAAKRNILNEKGDYFFERYDFKKAIVFYNMAYQLDETDNFSILKKAEAYTKLNMYPQAENCYRTVFEKNLQVDNAYRMKYAMVLLANNKIKEFREQLSIYNKFVEDDTKGENILVSSEDRSKLYKDTSVVINKTDTILFKIKYAGYKPRIRQTPEDNMLNIILSGGEQYYVPGLEGGYKFSFIPMEAYKLIIQRENLDVSMNPSPIQKAEIRLQPQMKYVFELGSQKLDPQYVSYLKNKVKNYLKPDVGVINLTALAKEMDFKESDIYTIRFIKADESVNPKGTEVSSLTYGERTVRVFGQSFFMLLPLKNEAGLTFRSDLEHMEKTFGSKKFSLTVDEGPVFDPIVQSMIYLTVNTESLNKVADINRLIAKQLSIIPATEYILTMSKPISGSKDNLEVIVPLTRGVKYNLSSSEGDGSDYKKELAEFLTGRQGLELANEEIIYISMLSKEIEVKPGENLTFYMLPVKQLVKKEMTGPEPKSSLIINGNLREISKEDLYAITMPFEEIQKMNLQTDIDYVKENFDPENFMIGLDTIPFFSEITIDTSGYNQFKESGWLVSMNVNTNTPEEVETGNQFIANEVSIIPGKEYILTVSKIDGKTKEVIEIIVPLTRFVRYDFTSDPDSKEKYKQSLHRFLEGRKNVGTSGGEIIDIRMISKELEIKGGDIISFSLLPARIPSKTSVAEEIDVKSKLFLDSKVVEFTQIQKFTIKVPLTDNQMNVQTNIDHLVYNFNPESINIDVDSIPFFSEIQIDTTGLGDRVIHEIKDPVFDVVIVNFDINRYTLDPQAQKTVLEDVVKELVADKRLYVTIKGFTDALGDADYNLKLSKQRAESVKEFLQNNGIGEARIRTLSFGAAQILEKNINWKELSEAELRQYRKVEIVIYLPK